MGLDGIELVLSIEEAFEVALPDEEIGRVATVGDLYDLVLRQLAVGTIPGQNSAECLTGPTFYRVRRAIAGTTGIALRSIRPSTELANVIPSRWRWSRWPQIESLVGLRFPQLTIGYVAVGLFVAGVAGFIAWGNHRWLAGLVVGSLLGWFGARRWPAFPRHIRTVGDLVRDVVALNYGKLTAERRCWTPDEVWVALRRIIVAQTGIDAARVVAEARLVDTLGID